MTLQVKIIKTVPDYTEGEVNKFLETLNSKDIHRTECLCTHHGNTRDLATIIEYFVRNE